MTTQAEHRSSRARTYTHCENCGKPKRPPPATSYVPRAEYEGDPFCSADCCREAHGTETNRPRGSLT